MVRRAVVMVLALASAMGLTSCRRSGSGPSRGDHVTLAGSPVFDKGGSFVMLCGPPTPPPSRGSNHCTESHFFVFPVARAGWKWTDPVPMWISCGRAKSEDGCRQEIEAANLASNRFKVMTLAGIDESGWNKAIYNSTAICGLKSAHRAPVVVYDP